MFPNNKCVVIVFLAGIVIVLSFACKNEDKISPETDPADLKVMSFNIRHDDDTDVLSLDDRKTNILEIITTNKPDIVGLQEFSDNWFETWLTTKLTGSGYASYQNKTESNGSPKVIFYKKTRFTCNESATFTMNYTEFRSGAWVILTDENTSQQYFVCNSHWTTKSSADRVKTANKILSVISENSQDLPLIVFGDFNAKPKTDEMLILLDNDTIDLEYSDADLLYTFNNWNSTGSKKIDWILHSPYFTVSGFEVIKTQFDSNWSSDHWPIMATFTF